MAHNCAACNSPCNSERNCARFGAFDIAGGDDEPRPRRHGPGGGQSLAKVRVVVE